MKSVCAGGRGGSRSGVPSLKPMHLNGKRQPSLPKPASYPISSRYKDLLTLVIWTLRILPLSLWCAVLDWRQKGGRTSKAQEEAGFLSTFPVPPASSCSPPACVSLSPLLSLSLFPALSFSPTLSVSPSLSHAAFNLKQDAATATSNFKLPFRLLSNPSYRRATLSGP